MDTRYLQTFREVAKWQSFTRAAEVLGYAQSSITTQIQNLENEFGVTLFERWGRKIRLTQSGEILLRYSEQLLAMLGEARENLAEESQMAGTLTIGTGESLAAFYLPALLQSFLRKYPKMKVLLQPGICTESRLGVKEGTYDFAVIIDRLQEHPDLISVDLGELEIVVIAAPEHRLTKLERVEAKDFAGENWILTEAGCSYRLMLETVLRNSNTSIETSMEFGSLEAIKQCVAYGLGVAQLPRLVVTEDVQKGKLAILPFSHPDIRVNCQLIYHKKKWLSQPLRHFVELLTNSSAKLNERVI